MEEATKMSSEVSLMEAAPDDLNTVDVCIKVVNGEVTKEDTAMEKEEDDTTFDGGFVKVEKEGINRKYEDDDDYDRKAEKQVQVTMETISSGSKSHLLEMEQKISCNETLIGELTQELEKKNVSESRFEAELLALEDLKGKIYEQETINLKLKEELKEKDLLYALSNHQEENLRAANEKLTKVLKEKQVLEEKLKILDENFSKTDALLSQALSNNSDLEQKLKSMEELSEEVSQLKSALIVAEEEEKDSARKMQEYQEKVSKLESSLNQSLATISELEEDLIIALQKGAEHEDLGNVSSQRILELQGLFQTSQLKLEKAEEKLKDLEAFQVKNSSLEAALSVVIEKERKLSENLNAVMNEKKGYSEKLKSAKERLEKQEREIDEGNRKNIELEALYRHSELRIQKSMEDFCNRDSEAKSLTEKSKDLEVRIRLYEGKLAEASDHLLSLKEELDQSSLENELLTDTNNHLEIKIQELEGYLDFEKETAVRQTEEATERFSQRDREAKELVTKLKSLENLIEEHKREVLEASGVADSRKEELEEALSKLKTLQSTIVELEKENGYLAEVNVRLSQELANHGSETSDFHEMFFALEAEKEQTAKELRDSKKAMEELKSQLTSEGERLRSRISSIAEENSQVNEIYQSTKNELVKLQEQLEVDKSKSDAMVSEIKMLCAVAAEKSVLDSKFEEVEKQLKIVEAQLKEEVKKVAELTSRLQEHEHKASDRDMLYEQAIQLRKELQVSHTLISEEKETISQKHSELKATLKKSQEELEAKKTMIVHLESLLKELEQKMQLADAKSKETKSTVKREVEAKSGDMDLSFSTPKQRKSKNESDASPSSSFSSENFKFQKAETSHLMTLKIVLGVALASVIIGIILGKKVLNL